LEDLVVRKNLNEDYDQIDLNDDDGVLGDLLDATQGVQ
jgi:hypothetical protein